MKIKIKDLRDLTKDELLQKKASLKETLFDLRGKAVSGTIEKPALIRETKKTIARIETILTQIEKQKLSASKKE